MADKAVKTELRMTVSKDFHLNNDEAARLLDVIQNRFDGERPTPEQLIAEARKKSSPIHSLFEWDVKTAAERYWRQRAQYLLRSLQVVRVRVDTSEVVGGPVRAFVPVTTVRNGPIDDDYYKPTKRLTADDKRTVIERARDEFHALFRRYKRYSDFMQVFSSVLAAFEEAEAQVDWDAPNLTVKQLEKKKQKKKKTA